MKHGRQNSSADDACEADSLGARGPKPHLFGLFGARTRYALSALQAFVPLRGGPIAFWVFTKMTGSTGGLPLVLIAKPRLNQSTSLQIVGQSLGVHKMVGLPATIGCCDDIGGIIVDKQHLARFVTEPLGRQRVNCWIGLR